MKFSILTQFTLFASCFLFGCSTIHIYGEDGKMQTEQGVGVVRIVTSGDQDGYAIRLSGVGVHAYNDSISIGYTRLEAIEINPSCHVVLWVDGQTPLDILESTLNDMEGVCIKGFQDNHTGEEK